MRRLNSGGDCRRAKRLTVAIPLDAAPAVALFDTDVTRSVAVVTIPATYAAALGFELGRGRVASMGCAVLAQGAASAHNKTHPLPLFSLPRTNHI
jgi:hypothetical protein